MDNVPKRIEAEITQEQNNTVSDWVKEAISKATLLEILPHEEELANVLLELVFQNTQQKALSLGMVLAAAFDLLITANYYKSLTNTGWYYCPIGDPALFFPFTNTCPRCVLDGHFYFEEANKPESGLIGQTSSRLLGVFLLKLFRKANRSIEIYKGTEPIDIIIHEAGENSVLLAEIKASPLITIPLSVLSDKLTKLVDGQTEEISVHELCSIPILSKTEVFFYLPTIRNGTTTTRLISLGVNNTATNPNWAYNQLSAILLSDTTIFSDYLSFWLTAFEAYKKRNRQQKFFWLTNACGQPSPMPNNWPKRKSGGKGFESVSDGKTSVGMDRTDDIKKGIYQVLKIGAESKPNVTSFKVKTGLISNIHAVRHYDDYLTSLEDVVWTLDKFGNKSNPIKKAGDIPPETEMYNLFDGIISFTESHIRDEWIDRTFKF